MTCTPPRLGEWFDSPVGRRVVEQETAALEPILAKRFGYHLVQVGGARELTRASRVSRRHLIGIQPLLPPRADVDAIAPTETLPIAGDSVDVVVLSHVLEFSEHPHEILRETERVLIPEGRVLILGFNPFSLWGLRGLLSLSGKPAPWCGKFMHQLRMRDWLALLGFELVEQQTLLFTPPCRNPRWFNQLQFMEHSGQRWWPQFGGVYLLHGKKRESTLTPIRPRWRAQPALVQGAIRPTTRASKRTSGTRAVPWKLSDQ